MKEYSITVDGKQYKIEITKHTENNSFSVKINDKPNEIKLTNNIEAEKPVSVKMQEKTYEVEMKKLDKKAPFSVNVNKIPLKVEFKTPERKFTPQIVEQAIIISAVKSSKRLTEQGAVVTPMAGKIVSVKVKEGETVKQGQVLCILEAMKMENEITAPKTGTVQRVNVSEGIGVSEGDILLIIN
jgi:biotin carboxyl carrier protein